MAIRCPQCRSDALLYFQAEDLNHHISGGTKFAYYRCHHCGLIFINPIPENLASYYETEYPPYKIPDSLEQLNELAQKIHWRVDLVRKYKTAGNLLEIGPSYGAFAYAAQQSGFQVDVIEMDENCCKFINSHTKIKAIHTHNVLGAMAALQTQYDVIALWHNLEHLVNPWPVLEQCARQLAPGGIIIISTPNPDSIQFNLFKKYWVHLDAPRHVALIPRSLLTGALKKLGVELAFTTTTDPDGLALNKMSWDLSISHLLQIADQRNLFRRIVSRVLDGLVSPIEKFGQLGTAYTAIYKKK